MRPLEERSPHELYLRASSAAKPMAPLKLYANVTGKFTVERELGEKVGDKVRDRTLVAQKKRTERTAILLDKPPELSATNGKKKKPQPTMFRKPIQPSDRQPTHNAAATRVQASPHPTPSTSKEGDNATRVRLIHFLATSTPRSPNEVVKALGGRDSHPSVQKILLGLLEDVSSVCFLLWYHFYSYFYRWENQCS
jgi:RNA polymerase II elongation factor ELL